MNEKDTIDAAEKAFEVLDDLGPVQAIAVVRNNPALLAGVAVLALSAGAAAGYFFAKKKLELKYISLAEQEIAEAKKFYRTLHKKDEYATPQDAVKARMSSDAAQALRVYQGEVTEVGIVEEVEVETGDSRMQMTRRGEQKDDEQTEVRNIFVETNNLNFDYETELAERKPGGTYVITFDEFNENEGEYEQSTLTWFEGDDVLSDEKDDHIPDVDATIGDKNLQRFGHGSKDHNVVYIRNERLEMDFEVTRAKGKYTEVVLGVIEHSDRRRPRKFRGDDD